MSVRTLLQLVYFT